MMLLCDPCHVAGGCGWGQLERLTWGSCGRCGTRAQTFACDHYHFDDVAVISPIGAEKAAGTHRNPDHHTSINAALHDLGRRGGQRERIALAHLTAPKGLTDEEAATVAKLRPQSSPWKRCTELREWGYLEYAGVDRPTSTGTDAKVWRLTDAGWAAIHGRGSS